MDQNIINSGILGLYKPVGETSRQTLNRLQRFVRPVKVGHAGTLDPIAEGVLVCCLGKATRLIDVIHLLPKHYTATFKLGITSDTEDISGNIEPVRNPLRPDISDIENTLPTFIGRIKQRPPVFSALKVGGKRAYDLARNGKNVELASREIDVHEIKILSYEYPTLVLSVLCGTGTYIRSLGRDIGERLGTGAVMEKLVRDFIGPFHLKNAIFADFFEKNNLSELEKQLIPIEKAVEHLPNMQVDQQTAQKILHGQKIEIQEPFSNKKIIAIFDSEQKLISLLEPSEGNLFKPKVNFS